MDGILFLSAIFAIGIVIVRTILSNARGKEGGVSIANAMDTSLLRNPVAAPESPKKPVRRRSF